MLQDNCYHRAISTWGLQISCRAMNSNSTCARLLAVEWDICSAIRTAASLPRLTVRIGTASATLQRRLLAGQGTARKRSWELRSIFFASKPPISWLTPASIPACLTDPGRVRFDLNTSLKLKVAKDL